MSNTKILTNVLIAAIIIGAVIFGYLRYFTDTSETTSVTTISAEDESSEFASLLRSARDVELKTDLFSGGGFSPQLSDYSVVLPDRPKGRSNPFAVPGSSSMTTASEPEAEASDETGDDEE